MQQKDKMVAMRFSTADHAAIKLKADKSKMNFTKFVTTSALNKPIVILNGIDEMLAEQKAIGRNLNQLTMLCNMGKIQCPDLTELKKGYAVLCDYLYNLSGRE